MLNPNNTTISSSSIIDNLSLCNPPFVPPLYNQDLNIFNLNKNNTPESALKSIIEKPNDLIKKCCLEPSFLKTTNNNYYKPHLNILKDVCTMMKSAPTGNSPADVKKFLNLIENTQNYIKETCKDDLNYNKFHLKDVWKGLDLISEELHKSLKIRHTISVLDNKLSDDARDMETLNILFRKRNYFSKKLSQKKKNIKNLQSSMMDELGDRIDNMKTGVKYFDNTQKGICIF